MTLMTQLLDFELGGEGMTCGREWPRVVETNVDLVEYDPDNVFILDCLFEGEFYLKTLKYVGSTIKSITYFVC